MTLAKLGLTSGTGLLRLCHKYTTVPIELFLEMDAKSASLQEMAKVQEEKIKQEKLEQEKKNAAEKERIERELIEKEKIAEQEKYLMHQEKMEIEKIEKADKLKIEQEEAALKLQKEAQRIEALRSKSQTQEMTDDDDWIYNPSQIEMIKAQQAITIQTISLVRETIGNKRNREEIPQVSLEERNIAVFAPSSTPFDPRSIDIPDDFYEVTKEDLRINAAIQKEKKKEKELVEGSLRTKEMRERDRIKKLSKYKKCFIRIRFPDRTELQGTFLPVELMSSVYQFVKDCLRVDTEFHLYTIPPKQILKPDLTTNLRDMNFLPACLIYFGLNEDKLQSPFLKEHLIENIKEKLPPPEIYLPPQEQSPIIISQPISKPVKVKKEQPQPSEVDKPTEDKTKAVPNWFQKGKK